MLKPFAQASRRARALSAHAATSLHNYRASAPASGLSSVQSVAVVAVIVLVLPLVYTRSFVRCMVFPDDADFHNLRYKLQSASAFTAAQSQSVPRIERRELEPIPHHSDAELTRMVASLPREEVYGKFPEVVLHGSDELKDVGFRRTRCFSRDGLPRDHFCAPSVLVAGYEKCGTSALYFKLSTHPEILAHPYRKEHCPKNDSSAAAWDWMSDAGMPRIYMERSNDILLNGCIALESKALALTELLRLSPDTKILVSLRNYADWSYSYYSYRCVGGYDSGCEKLKSPNQKGPWKDTRTPGNFDKLVQGVSASGVASPHTSFGVIRPSVSLYRPWLENLIRIAGRDAIMILRQEDLISSPNETLSRAAGFIGIDKSKFPDEALTLVSNTNDRPSQMIDVKDQNEKQISSLVNSGSVIFEKTRKILNGFWNEECEWLRDKFGVHFKEAC